MSTAPSCGTVSDGAGWRYLGRQQLESNRIVTRNRAGITDGRCRTRLGHALMCNVVENHSRVAYAESALTNGGERYLFVEREVIVEEGPLQQRLGLKLTCFAQAPAPNPPWCTNAPPLPAPDQRRAPNP